MLYELYVVTNKINNKRYVGQVTKDCGYIKRFKNHYKEALYYHKKHKHLNIFHAALIKYGCDNFKVERIADNIEESEIDDLEKFYIKKYHTFFQDPKCWGYNMTEGGQGVHGYKHNEETKQQISDKSKEQWVWLKEHDTEEYNRLCQLRSINLKGKPKSEQAKINYSIAARKNVSRPDYINPFKNKHHTEKTKQIISEKNGCKIGMYDKQTEKLIKEFQSCEQATQYLLENNVTKNKDAKSRILYVSDIPSRSAYGFKWKKL